MTGAAFGFASLFGARFLAGIGRGGAFPVASRGMQLWFPRIERGRIQGTTHFFSRFAVAVTPFIAGSIMLAFGWRAIFYIFGSLGIIWAHRFQHFLPRYIPKITECESGGAGPDSRRQCRRHDQSRCQPASWPTPWRQILLSPNMWYISLGYFCFFFGTNFYLTWYPTYLREHLHMSIRSLGILGSVPLVRGHGGRHRRRLAFAIMILKHRQCEVSAPRGRRAGIHSGRRVRDSGGADDQHDSSRFCCLAASFFFLEWVIGPAWAVPMDVGGQFSGTVTGVMNMVGALGGASTAVVYGSLFNRGLWVAPF